MSAKGCGYGLWPANEQFQIGRATVDATASVVRRVRSSVNRRSVANVQTASPMLCRASVGGCFQSGPEPGPGDPTIQRVPVPSAESPAAGLGAHDGPRKSIAVVGFESTGKFGGGDVGEGLTAMTTAALLQTDRFVVVKRQALADVIETEVCRLEVESIKEKYTVAKVVEGSVYDSSADTWMLGRGDSVRLK